ncbi:MAG: adenylate/guanylate cyclase domain-containing protein [Proteobacteria bacterium]|nr:adenylate/guanylate cyclase domain-containing protein [Pseudomonadota bacterium]MDA1354873.1 adenylate/guanylate cyclase domain-containing protein [Pseudomonadota bacterium]
MNLKTFFAYAPDDTDDVRLEKITIFLVAASCCLAGTAWTAMYYIIFGFGLVSLLPFAFVVIVGSTIVICHFTRKHRPLVYVQILCIIYITALIQWSIGSVFDSGLVLLWAFCGPIIALMFFSMKQSIIWLLLYLVNIAISFAFEDFFIRHGHPVSDDTRVLFFFMNLSIWSLIVFVFASYFVISAVSERAKADGLLLNILPRKTAQVLKSRPGVIAEEYDDASVLFADIVDFTGYSSTVRPDQLVTKLNEIFFRFDELTIRHGLEKIKTIGDAYMVAGGVPEPRPDHAEAIANLALDMQSAISEIKKDSGEAFSLRIGIHSGPVVAGVIGKNKFAYDMWGDTVNVASRMESSGAADTIQVTETVYRALSDKYLFSANGTIEIKGKGKMDTYCLLGPR